MSEEPHNPLEFADDTINAAAKKAVDASRVNPTDATITPEKVPLRPPDVVIKNLRTYQGDVAEAIKKQNASVLSVTMAEVGRREQNNQTENAPTGPSQNEIQRILGKRYIPTPKPPPLPPRPLTPPPPPPGLPKVIPMTPPPAPRAEVETPEPKRKIEPELIRNTLTILGSIVLIILGIGAVIGFYILQKKPPTIAPPAPIDQTIIAFNAKQSIPTAGESRDNLINELNTLRSSASGSDNQVLFIALTKVAQDKSVEPLSTAELFGILKTNIPGSLLRSFGDQFMLGMYQSNGNSPFLLVKLTSFDNAFAGMLLWEKNMNADLGSIFSARSVPITSYIPASASSTSTSTVAVTQIVNTDLPTQTGAQANSSFEDITIQNKDARVLKNSRGDDIILYSFLDQNTLLITGSESVFHEILDKYVTEQLVR